MTKHFALALAFAFLAASCGEIKSSGAPYATPDGATPPPPAADAATPPPEEPEGEECRIVGQTSSTREGCDVCEEAGWRCGPDLEWFCDDAACVIAPTEDAGTPPPPVEDAGPAPESDAGTPPPPPPPPAMEDAGTPPPPPPADLCAGSPDEVCVEACVGAGLRRCDPETGEYGECDIVVATPCADAGTPPPPPAADAGPACTPTTEVCDGIDNDCDGETDEAAPSTPLTESCYGGSAGTAGVAECRSGTRFCAAGGWSACFGQVVPATEICGNGLDEDCNGADLACAPSPCSTDTRIGTACSNGVGACRRDGTFVCSSGAVTCNAAPAGSPTTEICGDGIDQDCNGSDVVCAPPSGTIPAVFELRVNDPEWGEDSNQRIRDLVGDFLTCETWPSGRPPLGPVEADYYRCVLTINPTNYKFVGAFLSSLARHPGQLHTVWHDPSRPEGSQCVNTQGVTWRIYTIATDGTYTNLIPGGAPSNVEVSDGVCRHTLP